MEKFTHMSDGYYAVSGDACYEDQNEEYSGPAIERLAAYEASGLTPEQVFLYVQAKKEGLIQEHPCSIGDVVYELRKRFTATGGKKYDTTLTGCSNIRKIIANKQYEIYVSKKFCTRSDFNWMGKTVFLTEEEAKAKLEELQK